MNNKLPIKKKYAYLTAALLTILMVLQTSDLVNGQLQLNLNRIVLFGWNYLTWAFALDWVHRLTARYSLESGRWQKDIAPLLLIALLICGIQLLVSNVLYYFTLTLLVDFSWQEMIEGFSVFFIRAYASRLIDFIVIVGILRAMSNYKKLNEQKLAVAELESLLTQTRLEALKMQLNPHFLFNALHAIHSMIGYDNEKARIMLLKISSLLRKILEMGEKQQVSLSEELGYLRDYLDIEQERFHDRLKVSYDIPDDLLTLQVPSLLLQPLAENALKHGISQLESQGKIKVSAKSTNEDRLVIGMYNSTGTAPKNKVVSMGIGLSNLYKRLEQLYATDFSLKTEQQEKHFEVTIEIPKAHED